jgi:Putative zinc-finger
MKCEECQTPIEEYVDGGLGEKAGALVTAHIATCEQCASFREGLIREQAIYARYERDVEVTPMLWTSIEARIRQERAAEPAGRGAGWISRLREQLTDMFGAPRLSPALAFAIVLVAITVTVIVMTRFNSGGQQVATTNANAANPEARSSDGNHNPAPLATDGGGRGGEVARVEGPAVRKTTPVNTSVPRKSPATTTLTPTQLVREAEQKYLTAIAMLARDVNRKRSQLDPIMLARFDSALSDIDRTIKDTRRVVRDNPEDPIALQYLLAAYSKKVDVLRGMSAASTD